MAEKGKRRNGREDMMASAERDLKRDRLYLRVSSRQRELIREAAEIAEKDLSAFVLDAAVARAQHVLADRRIFKLSKPSWSQFVEILDRPVVEPSDKPRLLKLLQEPSMLDTPLSNR
jgi:uncharacterized protein (DUF1778 family)